MEKKDRRLLLLPLHTTSATTHLSCPCPIVRCCLFLLSRAHHIVCIAPHQGYRTRYRYTCKCRSMNSTIKRQWINFVVLCELNARECESVCSGKDLYIHIKQFFVICRIFCCSLSIAFIRISGYEQWKTSKCYNSWRLLRAQTNTQCRAVPVQRTLATP